MGGVCSIDLHIAAVSYFQSALNSGMVKNVTSVRSGTRVINVPWCHWISAAVEVGAVEVGVSIPPEVNL